MDCSDLIQYELHKWDFPIPFLGSVNPAASYPAAAETLDIWETLGIEKNKEHPGLPLYPGEVYESPIRMNEDPDLLVFLRISVAINSPVQSSPLQYSDRIVDVSKYIYHISAAVRLDLQSKGVL